MRSSKLCRCSCINLKRHAFWVFRAKSCCKNCVLFSAVQNTFAENPFFVTKTGQKSHLFCVILCTADILVQKSPFLFKTKDIAPEPKLTAFLQEKPQNDPHPDANADPEDHESRFIHITSPQSHAALRFDRAPQARNLYCLPYLSSLDFAGFASALHHKRFIAPLV